MNEQGIIVTAGCNRMSPKPINPVLFKICLYIGNKKIYGLGIGILTSFKINEVKGHGMTPGTSFMSPLNLTVHQ